MDRLRLPTEPTPEKVDNTAAEYRAVVDELILAMLEAPDA